MVEKNLFCDSILSRHKNICRKSMIFLQCRSIDVELKNIEQEISQIETSNPWIQVWLRSLYNQHKTLLHQNSIFWAQHARMQWVLKGDKNTTFFQNVACTCKHKRKISKIAGLSGNSFESSEGICDCFLNLYSSLCSSKYSKPIDRIFHAFSRDLPSLNSLDLEAMIKPVTKLR